MLRITKGDITLEADGEEAYLLACRILGLEVEAHQAPTGAPSTERTEKLRQLIEGVRGRQTARTLFALARLGETVKDSDLVRALGLDSNANLAGSLGGISKQAKKVHMKFEDIITRRKLRSAGGAMSYTYKLRPDVRELVLRELAEEIEPDQDGQ